jgi:hypothetical protein
VLPAATTKLKQTQPLAAPPPASFPTPVSTGYTQDEAEEEGSDMVNIVLAAVILLTTIFLGLLEYSKSRVTEVQEIGVVQKAASWTDLLSQ